MEIIVPATKICTACNGEFELGCFYHTKTGRFGVGSTCKLCMSARGRLYRANHKEKARIYSKSYCGNNKEKIVARKKVYYAVHKKEIATRAKIYYAKHKEKIAIKTKAYRFKYKKEITKQRCEHYREHREELRTRQRERYAILSPEQKNVIFLRQNTKRITNPQLKLNHHISNGIRKALNGNKTGRLWESLVGYTLLNLKKHLEKQFDENMTWDNYGKWHIDHRIPISVFNFTKPEHEDFKRCWALSNLQPLWAKDNLSKRAKLTNHFQPSLLI